MYELIKISEQSYYISCPAKIGVYDTGDGVYIVDAGSDKDAGRRVRKTLDEQGWKLKAVLVTHSNADHIGGCQYLQRQTGCKIFAPGIEGAVHARAHSRAELPLRRISAEAAQAQIPHGPAQRLSRRDGRGIPEGRAGYPAAGAFLRPVRLSHARRHGLHRRLCLQPGDA